MCSQDNYVSRALGRSSHHLLKSPILPTQHPLLAIQEQIHPH